MLQGKKIVLGITGGIAAYKTVSLLRLLKKNGAEVQVIMTPNAREFVGPVTLSSLSGNPVITDFFTANTGEWHSHVDLGLWADLLIIAPATASTIGKMAYGIADNMLITTYLSAKEAVMIAPAMDLDMFRHPSTSRNLEILKNDGVVIIEPSSGELASGLSGKGRMAEPEEIFNKIREYFSFQQTLKGKKFLVTAGPTHEKIDPVRFIGNYSSGKMGYEIASALEKRGAEVILVSGPVILDYNFGNNVKRINVESAQEMYQICSEHFHSCDGAVFAAAVADYSPEMKFDFKVKREKTETMILNLKRNKDIARTLSEKKKNRITLGFALETDNELDNARKKLQEKHLDLIVLNSLRDPGAGFMTNTNKVTIISKEGNIKELPLKSKKEIAFDIVDALCNKLIN